MIARWQEGLSDICHLRAVCRKITVVFQPKPLPCCKMAQLSSILTHCQILHCFVLLFLRTWNTLSLQSHTEENSKQATGSHVKQMPYECLYKKCAVLEPCPANLSRWCEWVRQVGGQPDGGGSPPSTHTSPVSWVSAPGGTGTFPRGVLAGLLTRWHLIPVLIFL